MSKFNWGMRACGTLLLRAGVVIALSAQTTAIHAPVPNLTTLLDFNAYDGFQPNVQLIQATDGNLYGMTAFGGLHGEGTIFKMTPAGTLTTLYDFCSQGGSKCTDGAMPYGVRLVQATDGNFYGVTPEGGASSGNFAVCEAIGCGTVFKITSRGQFTTIYNFCSQGGGNNCTDGTFPYAGLVQATNGDFYGTTAYGGGTGCGGSGCGTVFKITSGGLLTKLHTFDSADGWAPEAALIQATDGNLYGTTRYGGANGTYIGTVFRITPSGTLTTLYSFCTQSNCADGGDPSELIQGANGNFYGTTHAYGPYDCAQGAGCGTVFTITPTGQLTTLYNFGHGGHGNQPEAGLIQATDGDLYGTTPYGGANTACVNDQCRGTLFKITPAGKLTTLYRFCSQGGYNCTDGANPQAALVQDTNGQFYGTTYEGGGLQENGTVFSLSVGLGPFVETHPTSGKVGANVKIMGTDLTGATSVTFNGTAATFTVKSKSEITTTVPTGATTGTVQVATPGGTLSSNVPFRVK
jgi:uncharacterized repeat protein (TIGR03803 family)